MGNVFSPIGDMLERINDHLANDGYQEKLSVRSKMFDMILTTEHELNNDEKDKVKNTLISQFNTSHPAWKVKIESFRRQSGNVLQLVNQ